MDASHVEQDLVNVLFTEKQIQDRLGELARDIERDYEGQDLLIVGILRGAVMVMADLARSLERHVEMDWMAISSYGSGTKSSGVVRILKDLDTDISGRHVLIVDEIIDTGLTLSWLTSNLSSREPASVEICTLLRKPEALQMPVEVKYVGWDIRTSSWSATASTTASGTATCATSAPSLRTSTADRVRTRSPVAGNVRLPVRRSP